MKQSIVIVFILLVFAINASHSQQLPSLVEFQELGIHSDVLSGWTAQSIELQPSDKSYQAIDSVAWKQKLTGKQLNYMY